MYRKTIIRLLVASLLALTASSQGSIVWTGPNITFSKANFANPGLSLNQDRITSSLWITRGSSQGLYNASDEASFAHFLSPQGTQWADGSIANYASLSYTDWNTWVKGVHGGPETTLGVQAVVHDTLDDIYFSITFNSWTSGGAGGGFSYTRSTGVVPEPSTALLLFPCLFFALKAKKRSLR
jgi:hypothetical protein